jgi:hypothetical protein
MNQFLSPDHKRILQAMTPSQKWKAAMDLYHSAKELKAAGLRHQHPDWTEEQVRHKVREIFTRAGQ